MARFIYPAGGGGSASADIADFIFINEDEDVSKMTLPINKEMTIETTRDDDSDCDINIRSADDVFITAQGDDISLDAFNEVDISTNDENYQWTFTNSGCIRLPGNGEICNPINSSGDGLGYSTISITPDAGTEDNRYIIIDPTAPNHIHIRAGGNIDESGADLFLGGEKNNVVVSDSARDVFINTRPDMVINSYTNLNEVPGINFIVVNTADIGIGYTVNVDGTEYLVDSVENFDEGSKIVTASGASFTAGESYTFFYNPEYTNSWEFGSNGYLYGPAEGGLKVLGISNPGEEQHIFVTSGDKVLLNGANGEFLNDYTVPGNQIATIGDVDTATDKAYISVSSSADQGPFTADAIQAFTYTDVDFSNDITLTEGSKINFAKAGKYNIAFSAQMHQTNSSGVVQIWMRKNGNNMPSTNTKFSITANNPYYVAAWNLFVDIAEDDFIELVWSSDDDHTKVEYEPATGSGPTEKPAIPSIILTVNQID